MNTFREEILESSKNSNSWDEIINVLKNKKTSTGKDLIETLKEYQRAITIVQLYPSAIKPYLEEDNIEFPNKKDINNLIDAAGKLKDLTKIKIK